MTREELQALRDKLIRRYMASSISMKKRYSFDLDSFNAMVITLGYKDLVIDYDFFNFYLLRDKIDDYMFYFEYLADVVIDMYKDMGFFCYGKKGYTKLSLNDKKDIFREFMSSFCPKAWEIYKDLYDGKKIFFAELDQEVGEAFVMQESNEHFMAIDRDFSNDLYEIEGYIHELMHVYSHVFLRNYSPSQIVNTFNGFYLETIPLYAELEFFLFMMKNHICTEQMCLHANFSDYLSLTNFKTMKYLSEMINRDDAYVILGNITYEVQGNNILDIDSDVPFFRYPERYKEGYLNDFIYSIGILDAYDLLEKRLNSGKKPIDGINEYLIGLQDQDKFFDQVYEGKDITFMRDQIADHLEKVRSLYIDKK